MNGLTPYPIIPIGNFIGVILALLPLVSQTRKLSVAVWAYAILIAIYCFQMFVNSIIWHNNVNIVVPVWCDIVTKIQVGVSIGTRTCALVICMELFKITRDIGLAETITKEQKRRALIVHICMIVGFPLLTMGLSVIVQPVRFEINEESGCTGTSYSYVGYIIDYVPILVPSLGCVVLAPFTLRVFLRRRKEMNEFLSTNRSENEYDKYYRLVFIACLDTFFNVPVLLTEIIMSVTLGKESSYNYPYISWKNVHDGVGGNFPGATLSTILQVPASVWSRSKWVMFTVKWDEWIFVFHATIFFVAFGTTPEMRKHYQSVFWFIPERLGYKRKQASQTETISDVAFNSNPNPQATSSSVVHSSPSSHFNTIITRSTIHSLGVACADSDDVEKNSKGTSKVPGPPSSSESVKEA
ncbi:STE3-domain-containing protein [Schizopora paradoxa]|uniref:STE3-domain-containing protein n=1 Tax=Schizopora paradoxa TaxID=27342 RepID=A0A0H2R5E4_9AGAM|nr:STE3-domain-containing protein [Schizopora paradoxa]